VMDSSCASLDSNRIWWLFPAVVVVVVVDEDAFFFFFFLSAKFSFGAVTVAVAVVGVDSDLLWVPVVLSSSTHSSLLSMLTLSI